MFHRTGWIVSWVRVPTCSHFTFRTLSDFATSVYLIVTFSISANTQHAMTFESIWHRNFISYTLYLFANSARNCATRKKDQSWPIYYRISNKLLDAKHDLEVERSISNNNKLFQSFHDALIRKWTSYTFLNISPSVNILTGGCSNPAESTTCSYHQGQGGINCKIIYKLLLAHLMIWLFGI